MRAPKLLPWIARKAGISDDLALKLWRRAAGESEKRYGCCDSSDYYAATLGRFIDLVEDESGVAIAEPTAVARTSWIWRHQERISRLHGEAMVGLCRLWQSRWGNFLPAQKKTV
jgi:hypothetical protein